MKGRMTMRWLVLVIIGVMASVAILAVIYNITGHTASSALGA